MRKNFLDLIDRLTSAGGDFIIVGGVAAALYGGNRVTFDLDVVPSLDADAWASLVDIIWRLGGRPRIPETKEAIASAENIERWIREKGMRALTFRSPEGTVEVDLLVSESSRFAELKERAFTIEVRGRNYFVASIDDLIEMKSKAGRPQDLLDIKTLEEIRRRSA